MAEAPAGHRRIVGIALLASAGVMLLLAALFATAVIDVGADLRTPIAAVLCVAAVVDALVGFRFLFPASA